MAQKKVIQVFAASILCIGLSQAEIKSLVDAHIQAHGDQLGDLADTVHAGRVKIGYQDTLLDNPALRHAKEVADIINEEDISDGIGDGLGDGIRGRIGGDIKD